MSNISHTNHLLRGYEQRAPGCPSERLYLARHAYVARLEGVLILLDLRGDTYLRVERPFSHALGSRLGLPPDPIDVSELFQFSEKQAVADLVHDLIDHGLLTTNAQNGKQAAILQHSDELGELPRYGVGGPAVRFGDVAAFARSSLLARMLMRTRPIEQNVGRVARRKRGGPKDIQKTRMLVEVFRRLRPFTMGRRDECLLNSLALIEFLATYGVYASWHFGVRVNEFLAHCWVQEGPYILNDDLENVAAYTPIMRA